MLAAGQARKLQETNPAKVFIYGRTGEIREHEMWRGNPRIGTRSDRPFKPQTLINGPGVRPYIAGKTDTRWTWRDFTPTPAEIHFTPDELAYAEQYAAPVVVIEPNNKAKASPNKDWGLERWTALARMLRDAGVKPVQLGPAGTRLVDRAVFVPTPSFRHACAVLARARCAVLPEGGLHHAAAALNVPAVVIYGGFISPSQTGYALHVNLFTGDKPCGWRVPCTHCAQAMAAITPAGVFAQVQKLLEMRA